MADSEPVPLCRRVPFALFTTLVILGGVEAAFHTQGYGSRLVAVLDEQVGWRNLPSQRRASEKTGEPIEINAHGLRDEEFPRDKPPGEHRVLLLGDSLTFGIDVHQEKIFPRLLDQAFEKRLGPGRVRVMNGGVQGYDVTQERDFLEHYGFALDPDVVVVCFYQNDLDLNERRPAPAQSALRDLLRHTATFHALEKFVIHQYVQWLGRQGISDKERQRAAELSRYVGDVWRDPSVPEHQKLMAAVRRIYAAMAEQCAARGVKFAVATLPENAMTADPSLPNVGADLQWNLEQQGIPCISLLQPLAARHPAVWLDHDPGHFSAEGHRIVAAELERFLLANGLVPSP